MSELIQPRDEAELAAAIAEASETSTPLEIIGAGTKRGIGKPLQTAALLSTEKMNGVTLYEPNELFISAQSGTPLVEIQKTLAKNNQQLAFEPIDLGPMLGEEPGQGTIGAVFAANQSGSRRIQVGAARDHFIGMRAVNGRGEIFKSGGRVMKNVTGYDLCRGLAGSWGTLAVMSEVTMKVLPKAESSCTLLYKDLTDDVAVDAMCSALGTPFDVSGTVHLHEDFASPMLDAELLHRPSAITAIRLENFKSSLEYRSKRLSESLVAFGEPVILDDAASRSFWAAMQDLTFLHGSEDPVWRISTAPTQGARLVSALARRLDCKAAYDWSGGLIWLQTTPSADAGATEVRRVVAEIGGHATLVRADASVRASVDVFQPLTPAVDSLTRKLKQSFDPAGILSPGRMYSGNLSVMETNFTPQQLLDPRTAEAESILRRCVHCGLCTATCSTYVLLGDERDSPRGRIYLMKDMFEGNRDASNEVAYHVDRCLSCLSCVTTCPSGVDYMHLVDLARAHIEETHKRPIKERLVRRLLEAVVPDPKRFAWALRLSALGRPFRSLFRVIGLKEIAAMLDLSARAGKIGRVVEPGVYPVKGRRKKRVALLTGCAQQPLRPSINEATIRLLNRHGVEVVVAEEQACCGALVHHMGRQEAAEEAIRRNVDAWSGLMRHEPLDAIIINASGCGTMVKDYGHVMSRDEGYRDRAEKISSITKDITEFLFEIGLKAPERWSDLRVAYHSACSMQHGQRLIIPPRALLEQAGFNLVDIPEGHICCGSAGTYNILQPELAEELRERKVSNIESVNPDLVAAGNIGCITQLQGDGRIPIVHTVELLDWALGGPCPAELIPLEGRVKTVRDMLMEPAST